MHTTLSRVHRSRGLTPATHSRVLAAAGRADPVTVVSREAGRGRCSVDRRLFWAAFIAWLARASDAESEQLERALAPYAQHVRPLADAVIDALLEANPQDPSMHLPQTLRAELLAAGWQLRGTPALLGGAPLDLAV